MAKNAAALILLAEAQAFALSRACAHDSTFDAARASLIAEGIADLLADAMEG